MRAMEVASAMKSGCFDIAACDCGKCVGDEHLNLVFKTALLMDIAHQELRSFCSTTAGYVKVVITYHCSARSRRVAASWEVRNPANELVLRSEPQQLSYVLAPDSQSGEAKLLGLLRVKGALFEAATAANRRRAA